MGTFKVNSIFTVIRYFNEHYPKNKIDCIMVLSTTFKYLIAKIFQNESSKYFPFPIAQEIESYYLYQLQLNQVKNSCPKTLQTKASHPRI